MYHAATSLVRATLPRGNSCRRSCVVLKTENSLRNQYNIKRNRLDSSTVRGSHTSAHSNRNSYVRMLTRSQSKKRTETKVMGTSMGTTASAKTIADFEASDIDGKLVKLSKYLGKVVLVVNVASK